MSNSQSAYPLRLPMAIKAEVVRQGKAGAPASIGSWQRQCREVGGHEFGCFLRRAAWARGLRCLRPIDATTGRRAASTGRPGSRTCLPSLAGADAKVQPPRAKNRGFNPVGQRLSTAADKGQSRAQRLVHCLGRQRGDAQQADHGQRIERDGGQFGQADQHRLARTGPQISG